MSNTYLFRLSQVINHLRFLNSAIGEGGQNESSRIYPGKHRDPGPRGAGVESPKRADKKILPDPQAGPGKDLMA